MYHDGEGQHEKTYFTYQYANKLCHGKQSMASVITSDPTDICWRIPIHQMDTL